MNKKNFLVFGSVLLLMAFAWLVYASTIDTTINNAGLASPIYRQNISGNFLLNVTAVGRGTATEGNFSWVNVSFINASQSWLYNITLYDNDSLVNQTFNISINSAGSSKLSSTRLQDGIYNISLNAQNTSESTRFVNNSVFQNDALNFLIIDNTAPNMTLHTPANASFIGLGGSFSMNATIMNDTRLTALHFVNFTNSSGGKSNYFNASNRGGDFWNATINLTELTEGENYLYFSANDTAGNLNNSNYVRVYVDTNGPTVSLEAGQFHRNYTWTTRTTPDLYFNFTDNTSPNASCELFVDDVHSGVNASARNNTQTFLTVNSSLSVGAHYWWVNCTDLGSNLATSGRGGLNQFYLDVVQAPTLTAPTNLTWIGATGSTNSTANGTAFTFNFTTHLASAGNASCDVLIGGRAGVYNYSGRNATVFNATVTTIRNNITLDEGFNQTSYVNCTFNGSYINTVPILINVDSTAPTVNLQVGQNLGNYTWTDDPTPDLYFNFTDNTSPNASCELFVDGTRYGVNSSVRNNTQTFLTVNSSLSLGTHYWWVNCTDFTSNLATSGTGGATYYWFEYTTLNVTGPTNGTWKSSTALNSTNYQFNIRTYLTDTAQGGSHNASCTLYVTNNSATDSRYVKNLINTTVRNATLTTLLANTTTLVHDLGANWTVNCTWNGSMISLPKEAYHLNVDNDTVSVTATATGDSSTTGTVSITTNEVATCKYSTINTDYTGMYQFASTGGTSHTHSFGGLTESTGYTHYVRCQDQAGNGDSSATSIGFTTAASSAGGGGGGAGSGVNSAATGQFSQQTWSSINAGETATVEVENGAIGITEVSFGVEKTTYGAWVKVEKVESLPSSVSSFDGDVYRNVKISHSNVEKAMKDTATIDFKVEKTWLKENNVLQNEVALYRHVENKWVQLTTTVGEDDGTYVHYSAQTPGFSYFVIGVKEGAVPSVAKEVQEVGKEVVKSAQTTDGQGEQPVEEAEGVEVKSAAWKWLLPVIVAVIAVLALAWFYLKK